MAKPALGTALAARHRVLGPLALADGASPRSQESAGPSCFTPGLPAIREDAGGMIQKADAATAGGGTARRAQGAAYGLAGLVKGLGILSLKQEMMAALTCHPRTRRTSAVGRVSISRLDAAHEVGG